MNYNLIGVIGITTILGGFIYKFYDEIKMEYLKSQSQYKAKEISINFFLDQINKNPDITLDEAILRFENAFKTYKNLNDFAVSKKRTADNYRKAYSQLFVKAQRKYLKKNQN